MDKAKGIKLETQYFTLYELAEGIYAAIEKENSTGSNAGIIDLGDSTVIFDTFLNIDAARELKKASEMLTKRKTRYIINSHGHTDHFVGNCLFAEEAAAIISTEAVRDIIEKGRQAYEAEKDQYLPRIKEIYTTLKSNSHTENKSDLYNELQFLESLTKPGVELRAPNTVIETEMTMYGSKRTLHLKTFGTAHSPGDMIAYLPEDKICFMGDLLSNHGHAWLGSGSPEHFIEALEEISKYDIESFIPGHGALSKREDVLAQIQYINEMLHLVKTKNSLNIEGYSINDLSPMFREWKSLCFSWNINFLVERMKKENTEEASA